MVPIATEKGIYNTFSTRSKRQVAVVATGAGRRTPAAHEANLWVGHLLENCSYQRHPAMLPAPDAVPPIPLDVPPKLDAIRERKRYAARASKMGKIARERPAAPSFPCP